MDNREYDAAIESVDEPQPHIVGEPTLTEKCDVLVKFSDGYERCVGWYFYREGAWVFSHYAEYDHIYGNKNTTIWSDLEGGRARLISHIRMLNHNYNLDLDKDGSLAEDTKDSKPSA